MNKLLSKIYYDAKNPASFGGQNTLYKEAKKIDPAIKKTDVVKWLTGELTYTLHKPARRRFKRNPIIVSQIDEQWQADLVDMQKFEKDNQGFKHLLTVIDMFSKFAWAIPIKSKSSREIVSAFQTIFDNRVPCKLQTDQGKEFINKEFKYLMKKHKINFFTAKKDLKCSIIERFNRSLKSKMFKYFTAKGTRKYTDVLKDLVSSYNNRKNRSIGMCPTDVTDSNENVVFYNLYKVKSLRTLLRKQNIKSKKLKVGDSVRVKYKTTPFDKGYYPNWTDQVFKISKVVPGIKKPFYKLKDEQDNQLDSRSYQEDIQKISDPIYRIERIIKRRTRNKKVEYFVKWLNYPISYNSWIPSENIVNFQNGLY